MVYVSIIYLLDIEVHKREAYFNEKKMSTTINEQVEKRIFKEQQQKLVQ